MKGGKILEESYNYENWKEEKIDGKLYLMSPSANPIHQQIIVNITTIFKNYLKKNKKGCNVYGDGIDIYLDEDNKNYVIPDVTIICDKSKIRKNGYYGIPNLIVEVLSPSTIKRDENEKLKLYEKFQVPEYWMVDYGNNKIIQHILKDGGYHNGNIWVLLDEFEFKRLPKDEQETYTTKFKTSIFEDLEIELNDIFEIY